MPIHVPRPSISRENMNMMLTYMRYRRSKTNAGS